MSENTDYLYEYRIHEIIDSETRPIAIYKSNAACPSVGTLIDITEHVVIEGGFFPLVCKVVEVRLYPYASPENKKNTSEFTEIVLVVASVTKNKKGEFVHAKEAIY